MYKLHSTEDNRTPGDAWVRHDVVHSCAGRFPDHVETSEIRLDPEWKPGSVYNFASLVRIIACVRVLGRRRASVARISYVRILRLSDTSIDDARNICDIYCYISNRPMFVLSLNDCSSRTSTLCRILRRRMHIGRRPAQPFTSFSLSVSRLSSFQAKIIRQI